MKYDFTTLIDRSNQGSFKWNGMKRLCPEVPTGIVPFSVADMELKNPPEVIEGLKKYLDEAILGYTGPTEAYYDAMTRIPTPVYSQEEIDFVAGICKEAGIENGGEYFTGLHPLEDEPVPMPIGTDVAEVSHVVPTITLSAATMCAGTPLHHWSTTKQSGSSVGYKGMLYVTRCLAEGTKLLIENPEIIEKAWELHRK